VTATHAAVLAKNHMSPEKHVSMEDRAQESARRMSDPLRVREIVPAVSHGLDDWVDTSYSAPLASNRPPNYNKDAGAGPARD